MLDIAFKCSRLDGTLTEANTRKGLVKLGGTTEENLFRPCKLYICVVEGWRGSLLSYKVLNNHQSKES